MPNRQRVFQPERLPPQRLPKRGRNQRFVHVPVQPPLRAFAVLDFRHAALKFEEDRQQIRRNRLQSAQFGVLRQQLFDILVRADARRLRLFLDKRRIFQRDAERRFRLHMREVVIREIRRLAGCPL